MKKCTRNNPFHRADQQIQKLATDREKAAVDTKSKKRTQTK